MSEWWTYTLSDFLLFSPRTYYRLIELYNLSIWPLQILWLGLGIGVLVLACRGGEGAGRGVAAALASSWLWTGAAFHLQRYATINWAAVYFAVAFAIQAALLLWVGVIRGQLCRRSPEGWIERAGLGVLFFALVAYPLVGLLVGRPLTQIEVFGAMPDPTAVATLGIALLASSRALWVLLVIPILWCAVSAATLRAMNSSAAFVLPLTSLLVVLLALAKTTARRSG